MDRDEVEFHKNAKKQKQKQKNKNKNKTKKKQNKKSKKTRPIASHLDRTSLVNNGFIIRPKGYAITRAIPRMQPSMQDRPILPARVEERKKKSEERIRFVLPARGANHIIRPYHRVLIDSTVQCTSIVFQSLGHCYSLWPVIYCLRVLGVLRFDRQCLTEQPTPM